jgi:predicted DNA-binding antitoxin AbrB/MazE fold protein
MPQIAEAIFSRGVRKPIGELRLHEQQRARLIIDALTPTDDTDRSAALQRLRDGIAGMAFSLSGPLPSRDELHDRS